MHGSDPPPPRDTSANPDPPGAGRVTPEQLAAAARARDYWAGRRAGAGPSDATEHETSAPDAA